MVDWPSTLDQILIERDADYVAAADIAFRIQGFVRSAVNYVYEFVQNKDWWFIDGTDIAAIRKFYGFTKADLFETLEDAYVIFEQLVSTNKAVKAELLCHFPDEVREYASLLNALHRCLNLLSLGVKENELSMNHTAVRSLEKSVNNYFTPTF